MTIEIIFNQHTKEHYYFINNRYAIYKDGCIYDTKKAADIPSHIFNLRDNLLNQIAA